MGIKDWFGGDRKKGEFRGKAKQALSGKLAPGKAQKLAEVAREHEIKGKLPAGAFQQRCPARVQILPGETAHYAVQVEVLDRATASGMHGVPVKWNTPYVINSAKGHAFPAKGARELGEGYLLITSKRLFCKSDKGSAAVEYAPGANFFLCTEGIRLERTVGHTLLRFKSKSDETAEIVGELLAALMR